MDTITRWAVETLENNPDVMMLLPGGVYGQPIIPDPEGRTEPNGVYYEATADAFDPLTGRIRTCLSIERMPRTPHPDGWDTAFADYLALYFYGPDTSAASDDIETALLLVREAFTRKAVPNGEDSIGIIEPINDMIAPTRTADFPQAISAAERYRITSVRRR